MKLKFRAEKKDWTIFGIFSLVLFYIVSIGVLNGICNRGMPTEINIHGWNKPGL